LANLPCPWDAKKAERFFQRLHYSVSYELDFLPEKLFVVDY
jgi:hypothetical protein